MAYINMWEMLGYTNNAKIFMETFSGPASNIILTDNPEFTLEDFQKTFPVFNIKDEFDPINKVIPIEFFNLILDMANKSLKYDRFHSLWKYLMCLYIAHFCTLFLQTQQGLEGSQGALAGALPKGLATSKTVEGLSVSYDFSVTTSGLEDAGSWNLTAYGQQLVTLSSMYGHGGMWVNG